mgnify:CR=1 FL=1
MNLPNKLTVLRVIMVPFFVFFHIFYPFVSFLNSLSTRSFIYKSIGISVAIVVPSPDNSRFPPFSAYS